MSERYIKVFSGNENLFVEGAPLVIRASALLKDTATGKMIAQLKFQNVSEKIVSYVKVTLTQLDSVKKVLDKPFDFEYLDISVAPTEDFGAKNPITLPNASTRAFLVGVVSVGFSDGTVWSSDNTDWNGASADSEIAKKIDAEAIYKKAVVLSKGKDREDVQKAKELFESIAETKDVSAEIERCHKRFSDFETQKENKAKNKKKIIKSAIVFASILIIIVLLGYFVIYPFMSVSNGDFYVYVDMYNVEHYEIPEGTTRIDNHAFLLCRSLKSVTIPSSVTQIGVQAFAMCPSLESITIPDSVVKIEGNAFQACSSLKEVTLSKSLTSIPEETFAHCYDLKNIVIPEGVTSLGREAFSGCEMLESITIPSSVVTFGGRCFFGCDSLKSVNYGGTKSQWQSLVMEGGWDFYSTSYTVYCTDGTITP